jgi:hypothetical protein
MPYKNKEALKQRQREWYLRNKESVCKSARQRKVRLVEAVRDYKKKDDVFCVDCGEGRWQCLHFDHREDEEKVDEVGKMARRGMPLEKIFNEINKCDVVCANCHHVRHNGYQWREDCNQSNPLNSRSTAFGRQNLRGSRR